jgi:hypothetical protein
VAQALLTLLGATGEACGLDRTLKANTVKTRTMSLYNQGCCGCRAIPSVEVAGLSPSQIQSGARVKVKAAPGGDGFEIGVGGSAGLLGRMAHG